MFKQKSTWLKVKKIPHLTKTLIIVKSLISNFHVILNLSLGGLDYPQMCQVVWEVLIGGLMVIWKAKPYVFTGLELVTTISELV